MTLKITELTTVASFKINMCQTAMLDWESASVLLFALARLKFLWILFFSPHKFLSYVSNPLFQSASLSKVGVCSRGKTLLRHLMLNSHCCVLQTLCSRAPN